MNLSYWLLIAITLTLIVNVGLMAALAGGRIKEAKTKTEKKYAEIIVLTSIPIVGFLGFLGTIFVFTVMNGLLYILGLIELYLALTLLFSGKLGKGDKSKQEVSKLE